MRNVVCVTLVKQVDRPRFVFLTGDLGFMALEPLQTALGNRFINAGISEQNMVSVAAGLATSGLEPWLYSIAPFLYARAFEQIRNDVCLHDLPVRLVANGGGYGYGVMGSTHHAIEDYGALLSLQNMQVFVPAFSDDIPRQVDKINETPHPVYLRLGRNEKPASLDLPRYAAWRRLVVGCGATVVVVGPLAGSFLSSVMALPEGERPNVWVLAELPVAPETLPADFVADVAATGALIVAEEHVRHGGAGQAIAAALLAHGAAPRAFVHRFALGYPSGRYGSQDYHRRESGIDAASLIADVNAVRR